MRSGLRVLMFVFGFAFIAAWVPQVQHGFDRAVQQGRDYFDNRPVETMLVIGNSRTYYHDMPDMVRRMADSAHARVRYAVTTRAWGGASFETNWADADVQRLLRQHWDHVILQAESRAQANAANNTKFETYGEKLVAAAHATRSPAVLIVNWGYGESLYANDHWDTRSRYIALIQSAHRVLAQRAGADLIKTGQVWEEVHARVPGLPLYEDGNHPTAYGSYLSALMIYGFISGTGVRAVTYRPDGVDEANARLIRDTVDRYYSDQGE